MQIALDDPIWRRLYGPYETHDVPGRIARLQSAWDDAVASDLFWTDLHHQEDLYPVTYAALPWLWDLARGGSPGAAEIEVFASEVVYHAVTPWSSMCSAAVPHRRYRGLSLQVEDHQFRWIAVPDQLTAADMGVLSRLEAWFTAAAPGIVAQAVAGIRGSDRYGDYVRASGFAAWQGGIATAVALWESAEEPDEQLRAEHVTSVGREAAVVRQLRAALGGRAPELAAMLDRVLVELAGG